MYLSLRLAKSLCYEEKLESKKNAKGTWKILNQMINRNHGSKKLPSTFTINNLEISDPNLIANRFCKFFTNRLWPALAKQISSSIRTHKSFLPDRLHNSFFLESTTQSEIVEIANPLRLNTVAGHDKISMWSAKESVNYISVLLTYVSNLPINSGIVPAQMKLARVVPLYKSGNKSI